jgi:hypothetical protein
MALNVAYCLLNLIQFLQPSIFLTPSPLHQFTSLQPTPNPFLNDSPLAALTFRQVEANLCYLQSRLIEALDHPEAFLRNNFNSSRLAA